MSRPKHLGCINTTEGIRRINQDQEAYDRDPEAYERKEAQAKEDYEREQQELAEQFRRENDRNEDSPF